MGRMLSDFPSPGCRPDEAAKIMSFANEGRASEVSVTVPKYEVLVTVPK